MNKSVWILTGLLIIVFFHTGCSDAPAASVPQELVDVPGAIQQFVQTDPGGAAQGKVADPKPSLTTQPCETQVTLSAPDTTVSFNASDSNRTKFDLPALYFHHNRDVSAVAERTLDIAMAGLAAGTGIQIEVTSRNLNVSTNRRHRESRSFVLPDRPCTCDNPCVISWAFDPTSTPSDMYSLRVTDPTGATVWKNPHSDRPDFVALDTWDVTLDAYTVRVIYARLFPFARGFDDMKNRLPPSQVPDFIEHQFVPIIQETWNAQIHDWGFGEPIHAEWDRDKIIEVIVTAPPIALFGGTGPYTVYHDAEGRLYPERRIWWACNNHAFHPYDSLANAYRVVFAHEFFHLLQWNVLLWTERPTNYGLASFIEPQGRLAPSVQYPELELGERHLVAEESAYLRAANRFLGLRLDDPFRERQTDGASKYDAALYWRFVYEQYGSMAIIRAALEEMAIHYDRNSIGSFASTMDAALARVDGPFSTFEESLIAFSQANYALRLGHDRCASQDLASCDSYQYDADGMYADPPLAAELVFNGGTLNYTGALPSSYGMDFVELKLTPSCQGRPLMIQVQSEGAQVASFEVQIWGLDAGERISRAATSKSEVAPQNPGAAQVYLIPDADTVQIDRLALIIVRLDPDEAADSEGTYRLTFETEG